MADGPGISDGDLVRLARDGNPAAFRLLRGDGDRLERLVHDERGATPAPQGRTADELTSRMLRAIGATVTGVDIDELGPEVTAARIALNSPAGPQQVTARLADGLAVAITTGAPVRVADAVMDRLAVPAGSAALPDLGPAPDMPAEPGSVGGADAPRRPPRHPRSRYQPRNMTFVIGLFIWARIDDQRQRSFVTS